jgi:hypothetical protein
MKLKVFRLRTDPACALFWCCISGGDRPVALTRFVVARVFVMCSTRRKVFRPLHLFLVWGIIWSAQTCLRFVFGLPAF